LTGIVFAPLFWVTPSLGDLGLFALAGIFGSVGVMCLTHAFRLAPVAVVSPFEYSALIWATLLGFLMWGELPDGYTLIGVGVVILSGLYIIYREAIQGGRVRPRLPSMSPDDTGQ
jgi:drug/metabolite transporter (DMT)-like permease